MRIVTVAIKLCWKIVLATEGMANILTHSSLCRFIVPALYSISNPEEISPRAAFDGGTVLGSWAHLKNIGGRALRTV